MYNEHEQDRENEKTDLDDRWYCELCQLLQSECECDQED